MGEPNLDQSTLGQQTLVCRGTQSAVVVNMLERPIGLVNISDANHTGSSVDALNHPRSHSPMDGVVMASMKLDSDTKEFVEALTSEGLSREEKLEYLTNLKSAAGGEVFEFSTCNRVLYVGFSMTDTDLVTAVGDVTGVRGCPFEISTGMEVWRRLVRICSGLDSFILGELQVMGQFRDTVSWHKENEYISHSNSVLFDHVIAANRTIRKELGFDKTAGSMLNLATNTMKEMIRDNGQLDTLVLGFGEMAAKAVEALIGFNQQKIYVISGDPAKAALRYPELNDKVEILSFEQWVLSEANADLVISTLRNKRPTFTKESPFPSKGNTVIMDFSWPSSFTEGGISSGDLLYGMEYWIRRSRKLGIDWNYADTAKRGEEILSRIEENFKISLKNVAKAKFRSRIYATFNDKPTSWAKKYNFESKKKPQLEAFSKEIASWICQKDGIFDLGDLHEFVIGTNRKIDQTLLQNIASDINQMVTSLDTSAGPGA